MEAERQETNVIKNAGENDFQPPWILKQAAMEGKCKTPSHLQDFKNIVLMNSFLGNYETPNKIDSTEMREKYPRSRKI